MPSHQRRNCRVKARALHADYDGLSGSVSNHEEVGKGEVYTIHIAEQGKKTVLVLLTQI